MTFEKIGMSPARILVFWAAAVLGAGSYLYFDAGAPLGALVAGAVFSLAVTVGRIVHRRKVSRPA